MFEEPGKLLLGLLTGIIFGFLLQKGQVAKFHAILGQLLLKDFTVVKTMATAIAVGTVGVQALVVMGFASYHVVTASLARVLIGGVLFGVGLAVFGLCPGTGVAACGEGRRDAMIGVLGMLAGAAAYVAIYPAFKPLIKTMADFGKVTLPQITSTSVWLWVIGVAVAIAVALSLLERKHPKELDAAH